jgi:L-ascorbate metabolism protein UlaG (beta-lactamase superfamily)
MAANVEWVGLACFRIWADGGPVIVTDPYTPNALGLTDPDELALQLTADVVLASSLTDRAHSYIELVGGEPQVINALDVAEGRISPELYGEPVVAVAAAESADHPEGPKDNALYAFAIGGLWVMHMGDLGYGLRNHELEPFRGRCDVLLALAGEGLVLDHEELDPMIDFLKPRWIVPMHYGLAPVIGQMHVMSKVETFLEHRASEPVLLHRSTSVSFPLDSGANDRPTIVVLDPSGYEPTEPHVMR